MREVPGGGRIRALTVGDCRPESVLNNVPRVRPENTGKPVKDDARLDDSTDEKLFRLLAVEVAGNVATADSQDCYKRATAM
jgi:hypothetical protein